MRQQMMATLAACILAAGFAACGPAPTTFERAGAIVSLLTPEDEDCDASPLLPPHTGCSLVGRYAEARLGAVAART
jgi:hypothetical protein